MSKQDIRDDPYWDRSNVGNIRLIHQLEAKAKLGQRVIDARIVLEDAYKMLPLTWSRSHILRDLIDAIYASEEITPDER